MPSVKDTRSKEEKGPEAIGDGRLSIDDQFRISTR